MGGLGATLARPVARSERAGTSIVLAALVAAAVGGRWVLQVHQPGAGLATGLVFGGALVAIALVGGWRPLLGGGARAAARLPLAVGLGFLAGLALVALALATRPDVGPSLRPVVAFAPWVGVTILVASAEELVLRGILFTGLQRLGGPIAALLLTSLAFGLLHVPFYGWESLPLDAGVGLVFGGLRLVTRGVLAPAVAHVVADLATWWL